MQNLSSTEIEKIIDNSKDIFELQERLIDAQNAGYEFGASHILSELKIWGDYHGDTEGIYSWNNDYVLDSEFNLVERCPICKYAKWGCMCE